MTNPMGRSFLSYRRTRIAEAELLISAQHDLGIPTWQDIHNLDEAQTDIALESILADSDTANAVLWLTPDVKESVVIRRVEVPGVLRRIEKKDAFFAVPVCAGGLGYGDVKIVLDPSPTLEDLGTWNLRKYGPEPITLMQAGEIASRVLERRIETIHKSLNPTEPITVGLYTTEKPPAECNLALAIDWSEHFVGRLANETTWRERLLPSLSAVASAIRRLAPGRAVLAKGLASIPAAYALGTRFRTPSGMRLMWEQNMPITGKQIWSVADQATNASVFEVTTKPDDVNGRDLAVLVSVATDVRAAFAATKSELPPFRAIIDASARDRGRVSIESGGDAAHFAVRIVNEIRRARDRFQPLESIHLIMAVPSGLAVFLGQLTNALGPVRPYQYIPTAAVGSYKSSIAIES